MIGGIVFVKAINPKPTPHKSAPSASAFLSSNTSLNHFSGTSIKIMSTVLTAVRNPNTAFEKPSSVTIKRGNAPICWKKTISTGISARRSKAIFYQKNTFTFWWGINAEFTSTSFAVTSCFSQGEKRRKVPPAREVNPFI